MGSARAFVSAEFREFTISERRPCHQVTLAAMVTRVHASNRGMPYEALATVDVDGYVRKCTISVRPCAQLFCVRKCTQLFCHDLKAACGHGHAIRSVGPEYESVEFVTTRSICTKLRVT